MLQKRANQSETGENMESMSELELPKYNSQVKEITIWATANKDIS